MGLTLFTFAAAFLTLYIGFRTRRFVRTEVVASVRIIAVATFVAAIALPAGYLLAHDSSGIALVMAKISAAGTSVGFLLAFRLAVLYPYGKRNAFVDILFAAVAAALVYICIFTDLYLELFYRPFRSVNRVNGDLYYVVVLSWAFNAIVGALVLTIRAFTLKSRIFRQQCLLYAAGIAASILFAFIFGVFLPQLGTGILFPLARVLSAHTYVSLMTLSTTGGALYPLAPIAGFILVSACNLAFSATRVFHAPTVIKLTLSRIGLVLLFGLPAGFVITFVDPFQGRIPLFWIALAVAAYLVIGPVASRFSNARFGGRRDEEKREALETAIAHVDLSAPREEVMGEISSILTTAFEARGLRVLSENDDGSISLVYPGKSEQVVLEASSPLTEVFSSVENGILLKTDIVVEHEYWKQKKELIEFFESQDAEVLILAKEGRRLIGIFALTAKTSGGDYDTYDYDTFMAIQGKLFVIGYYVKHVARESLIQTVEREIELADQIVQSVQSHIDLIESPAVDAAFICRSTRKLGGDLFDAVKIADDKWFFVVGDVSGKGLNASMSMVILKSMIRGLLREEKDFLKLIDRTNSFIKDNLPRGTFFAGTFGIIALDRRPSIYFVNCGIPSIHYRSPALDSLIEVQGDGKMLGFMRNIGSLLKSRRLDLTPGTSIIITTDGIVEAESLRGERYGKERLVRVINENKTASASDMVEAILRSATAFTDGKIDDDVTILVLHYLGKEKSA